MSEFSPRKKPQQKRSRETYEQIVDAASQLLVEVGFHNTSTNKIAEEAAVSVGSVYQYFPNKEAIVLAVMQDFAERQYEILTDGLEDVRNDDLRVAIRKIVGNMIQAKLEQPELNLVLFEQLPPIGQHDIVHEWHGRAEQLVTAALHDRPESFRPDDLELAARMLVTASHGIFQDAVANRPELLDDERLVRETTEMMVRYLRPDQ